MNTGRKLHKVGAMLLTLALLISAGGCWDREELEELAYILALGIDYLPDEDKIEVTTAIIRPGSIPGGGQAEGGPDTEPFRLTTTKGETLSTALEQQNAFFARRPYSPHSQVVILGEELARKGLHTILDRMLRERDLRMTVQMFVTRDSVQDVLLAGAKIEQGLPLFLTRWAERETHEALATAVDLRMFVRALLYDGIDPVLPEISTRREEPIAPQEREIAGEAYSADVTYATVAGTAVFKEDKLVGFLNIDETKGYLYAMNLLRESLEITADPYGRPGSIVFFYQKQRQQDNPIF